MEKKKTAHAVAATGADSHGLAMEEESGVSHSRCHGWHLLFDLCFGFGQKQVWNLIVER